MNHRLKSELIEADQTFKFHDTPFLTPRARLEASQLDPAERQRLIKTLLVRYPKFEAGMELVARTHFPVREGTYGKGNITCLLGDTRAGKSHIVKAYMADHRPSVGERGETYPVIKVEVNNLTTPAALVDTLAGQAGQRVFSTTLGVQAKTQLMIDRLVAHGVQCVVIDDMHHLINGRLARHVREFAGIVRKLIDEDEFSILIIGEPSVLSWVINFPEISGRRFRRDFVEPFDRSEQGKDEFRLLLADIDDRLPFAQSSDLGNSAIAAEIYDYSDGFLGRVMALIEAASWTTINEGHARIRTEVLRESCASSPWKIDQREFFGKAFEARYAQSRRKAS